MRSEVATAAHYNGSAVSRLSTISQALEAMRNAFVEWRDPHEEDPSGGMEFRPLIFAMDVLHSICQGTRDKPACFDRRGSGLWVQPMIVVKPDKVDEGARTVAEWTALTSPRPDAPINKKSGNIHRRQRAGRSWHEVRMSWHGRRERHEGNNDDCDLTHPLRIGWNSCQECGAPGRCVHLVAISRDRWPDHIRLPDLEPLLVCRACVQRGADVRPDFD